MIPAAIKMGKLTILLLSEPKEWRKGILNRHHLALGRNAEFLVSLANSILIESIR